MNWCELNGVYETSRIQSPVRCYICGISTTTIWDNPGRAWVCTPCRRNCGSKESQKIGWSFDPTKLNFSVRKKFKSETFLDYEWYADRSDQLKSPEYLEGNISYLVRKVGDKYRIKIEIVIYSETLFIEDKVTERMWDCVIENGEMFRKTLKELLEEIVSENKNANYFYN